MKAIRMNRSLAIDEWTTLWRGEKLKVVKGKDGGGWYIGQSGRLYRTCTSGAAESMVREGSAEEVT